ncbi:HD domain-containing phosphohydrolase [Endothiovibrio diazotrophicus]
MTPIRPSRGRLRLSIALSGVLIMAIAAFAAAVMWNLDRVGRQAADVAARGLFQEVAGRIVGHVEQQLEAVRAWTADAASVASLAVSPVAVADHPALPFLLRALEQRGNLYSVYVGYDDRRFLQAIAVRGDGAIAKRHGAPAETAFIVRGIVATAGGGRLARWIFLDGAHHRLGSRDEPDPEYDPTARPWYHGATLSRDAVITPPYLFSSLQQPGVTVTHALSGGGGVIGADLALGDLQAFIARQRLSPHGVVLLAERQRRLLAYSGLGGEGRGEGPIEPLMAMSEVGSALVSAIGEAPLGLSDRMVTGRGYLTLQTDVSPRLGSPMSLFLAAPVSDFSGHITRMIERVLLTTVVLLALILPLAVVLARRMTGSLTLLAGDAQRIRELDFSEPGRRHSVFLETQRLEDAFSLMRATVRRRTQELEKLNELGISIAAERDTKRLLGQVTDAAQELTGADGAILYLRAGEVLRADMVDVDSLTLKFDASGLLPELPLGGAEGMDGAAAERERPLAACVEGRRALRLEGEALCPAEDAVSAWLREHHDYAVHSMLVVPLITRTGEVVGVLQLLNARFAELGRVEPFTLTDQEIIGSLAAQAAVALDNDLLYVAQKEMLDSFIRLIAESIDAKSPYTGAHCARVPELAVMLAREASASDAPPFADFHFSSDDEWREFRTAAWLHDCGKITTPEYVVDKATKLETIYNRIHEIRTRFEVLHRDRLIAHLEALAAPGADLPRLAAERDADLARLQEEFAFVAECNIGGEFMDEGRQERLRQIAERRWLRHFDDTLGLSRGELERRDGRPAAALPAEERLLDDKPEQIVRRDPRQVAPGGEFKMTVPEYLYNHGELYNLLIPRGTLTAEERFKINDHVVQTIHMLENLPLPKNMVRIPEYAGAHHETMIGTGYPRRLRKEEMSLGARIMAIADVFEALTATDRPYKKPKSLSEAVRILSFMCKDQHLDADLFELFLRRGIHLEYARRYLAPEQIDEVDVGRYLGGPEGAAAQTPRRVDKR